MYIQMNERKAKRQKLDSPPDSPLPPTPLHTVLEQLRSVHQLFKQVLLKMVDLDYTVLSDIDEELIALEQTRREGLALFSIFNSHHHWKQILSFDNDWISLISTNEVLALARCSSSMFELFSPIISQKKPFRQPPFQLQHYKPTILKQVTHLDFLDGVQQIHFGETFNKPITRLPHSVTLLQFGAEFNAPIIYPPNLTHLTFGLRFNPALHANFPPTVTHLTFFGHPPHETIAFPPNLQELNIHEMFNGSLQYLPSSLKTLKLPDTFNRPVDFLPPGLKQLKFLYEAQFNYPVNNLPSTLTNISFGDYFNKSVDNLPSSLTNIIFGRYFNQLVDHLPSSLTAITFGEYFNQHVDKLPLALTHLTFDHDSRFNKPVRNLPISLKLIHFGKCFNHPLDMPPQLSHLYLGRDFNQPLREYAPLKLLRLGKEYKHKLENLPPITHLEFEVECSKDQLQGIRPPPTLTHFTFGIDPGDHIPEFSSFKRDEVFSNDFPFLEHFYYRIFPSEEADINLHYTENLKQFHFEISTLEDVLMQVNINFITQQIYIYHTSEK